ncbi:hypothetical protein AGLY_013221 [Aphis glycines]|uniref:Uncharacterized protein n=1 Tax=Aphis glycines TaxID=307491 RepID=A0A6G0T6J3_APHGL|nr:hypothetical protein AGLY_013221 [Aphis glycines]
MKASSRCFNPVTSKTIISYSRSMMVKRINFLAIYSSTQYLSKYRLPCVIATRMKRPRPYLVSRAHASFCQKLRSERKAQPFQAVDPMLYKELILEVIPYEKTKLFIFKYYTTPRRYSICIHCYNITNRKNSTSRGIRHSSISFGTWYHETMCTIYKQQTKIKISICNLLITQMSYLDTRFCCLERYISNGGGTKLISSSLSSPLPDSPPILRFFLLEPPCAVSSFAHCTDIAVSNNFTSHPLSAFGIGAIKDILDIHLLLGEFTSIVQYKQLYFRQSLLISTNLTH